MKSFATVALFLCLAACGSSTADANSYLGLYSTGGGGSSAITLTTSCSRTSGKVPLAISVNTVGSVSTNTSPASDAPAGFHQIYYSWDFGDSNAAAQTWSYGSGAGVNTRNVAYGPVAAHVFDVAGTYTVQVTANDGSGTKSTTACIVTASDWPADTSTTCIGASTLPVAGVDGCPSGAAAATQSNMATAVSTYCTADGKRILFKHDDAFTGTPTIAYGCQIDMYGTGAKPTLSGNVTITGSDVRFINIDETGSGGDTFVVGSGTPTISNTLFYKSVLEAASSGHAFIDASITNSPHTGFFIVDSKCLQCYGPGEGTYLGTQDGAYMGNLSTASSSAYHNIRMMYAARFTINNNTFNGTGNTGYETVGIRAMDQPYDLASSGFTWAGAGHYGVPDTAYNVVSDNDFSKSNGFVSLMPEQYFTDATNRDMVIERNYFHASGGSITQPVYIRSDNVTVRDNVFDTSGYSGGIAISAAQEAGPVSNVWIYNNTAYSSGSNGISMSIGSGTVSNVTFINNLGYWSGHSSALVSTAGCTSGCTASNNSTNVGTNPSFVGPLTSISGFKPNTGSYAIGAGTSVPVWADFFNLAVPSPRDIGAANQ